MEQNNTMLVELDEIPTEWLPIAEFRERYGKICNDLSQYDDDSIIERVLRSAVSKVEAYLNAAIMVRRFCLSLTKWDGDESHMLPIRNALGISTIRIAEKCDDPRSYTNYNSAIIRYNNGIASLVMADGFLLPSIPIGGRADIIFKAGYGLTWVDLPGDIRHAALLIAANKYAKFVGPSYEGDEIPFGPLVLLECYRATKMRGGQNVG